MLRGIALGLLLLGTVTGCSAGQTHSRTPLNVYSTSGAAPWLASAYDCAPSNSAIVLVGPDEADVAFRLGEPQHLIGAAFQVGSDDLLVVTNPEVGVAQLSPRQAEVVFAGQLTNWSELGGADQAVQVWAFASTVDIQRFFERTVLNNRPISSNARLAVSAQHMSDSVGSVPGSIGILPQRWKAGNTREALIVGSLPVLALTESPPPGAVSKLIACMQSRR